MLNLNEKELQVKKALESAIEQYGVNHVDFCADYDSSSNDEIISIYYHSRHNSFGITDIPLSDEIDIKMMHELANELDVCFDNNL